MNTYHFTAFLPNRAISFTATISQASYILSLMTRDAETIFLDTSYGTMHICDKDDEGMIGQAIKDHFLASRLAYSIAPARKA